MHFAFPRRDVAQVGVRMLNESQPKALYYHMLAKHRFDEAAEYATLHGMDTKV